MNQNIWCRFFGIHKYEVYKEEQLKDVKGNVIGKAIITKCTNCGKIKCTKVYTEIGYNRM
jgi:hypothetical protein